MGTRQQTSGDSGRGHVLVNRNCVALVLHRGKTDVRREDGHAVFADFLQQNSMCFWNACLVRSVSSLEYRGCLVPSTLLVSGTHFALEVVRSAWARRVLRPPKGYTIVKLGDVGTVDMLPILQTQFAPLSEALCKVVADLNGDQTMATTESIRSRLEDSFPEMQVPCEDILHKTLGGLIRERKIYHTGNGYFIVSPDTYRQRAVSPLCERQMLMTNEEAIVRLHNKKGRECSLAIQVDEMDIAAAWKCSTSSFLPARLGKTTSTQSTQAPSSPDLQLLQQSHSVKMLRVKGHPKNNVNGGVLEKGGSFKESKKMNLNDFEGDMHDINKSEKQSMLAKILKRMQLLADKSTTKHVVFSAQFPPIEWLDRDKMHCHSVSTQTQLVMQKVSIKPAVVTSLEPTGSRIPWEDSQNNFERNLHSISPSVHRGRLCGEPEANNLRKNLSLPARQSHSKYSPSHRYSHHGTLTNYSKRRHRHRRSSSESPKAQKTLSNSCQSQSTSSKSNADNSDDKTYRSSSSASPLASPKPISTQPSSEDPGWARVKSYHPSKGGRDISFVQSPSNSLDREVLKDVKNISTSHAKAPLAKIGNIPPSHPEMSGTAHPINNAEKYNSLEGKSPTAQTNRSQPKDSSCTKKSSAFCKDSSSEARPETLVRPLILKNFVDVPPPKPAKSSPKEIIIDNSVSVEMTLGKSPSPKPKANNVSTTIVTEETTVTKANGSSKVVTATSITTSMSSPPPKNEDRRSRDASDCESDDKEEKTPVNDLNIETEKGARIIDCSSSCNIVTEVK